ncbi:MAG: UBP-type zinc finger domain-containing protein [Actinobacteria bacterium]|nr:UBP-type zinc finger domain-containing protein [Actinomycetota bacterium]
MSAQRATVTSCTHAPASFASPRAETCESCSSDFNLRACAECGHVGCCESQAGHNTSHYRSSGHPVIRSMPVDSGFTWCYECSTYL